MMKVSRSLVLCGAAFVPSLALAQNNASIAPLTTFGTNGYLAAGSNVYLGTGNTERGLAYNPVTGDLLLASRASGTNVVALSSTTGTVIKTLTAGFAGGGALAIDSLAVGGDGAIYVNNLANGSGNYVVYEYANEAATPTAVTTYAVGTQRLGDDLTVFGSGANTVLASGFETINGPNNYLITNVNNGLTTGGTTTTSSTPIPVISGTSARDFSDTITFGPTANSVLGSSANIPGTYQDSTYSITAGTGSGTLAGTATLTSGTSQNTSGEHILAYDVVDGIPLLAVESTGDTHVSIYDDTNPAAPIFLTSGLNVPAMTNGATTVLASNGNATGEVAWGATVGNTATLYTLATNDGIQAYTVTVPEPASLAVFGFAVPALLARRRRNLVSAECFE